MELLTSGLLVSVLVVLITAVYWSFTEKSKPAQNANSGHMKGHKKIFTRDGMVTTKKTLEEPLFLLGDSKIIR